MDVRFRKERACGFGPIDSIAARARLGGPDAVTNEESARMVERTHESRQSQSGLPRGGGVFLVLAVAVIGLTASASVARVEAEVQPPLESG
jgi:hypothetical protein